MIGILLIIIGLYNIYLTVGLIAQHDNDNLSDRGFFIVVLAPIVLGAVTVFTYGIMTIFNKL